MDDRFSDKTIFEKGTTYQADTSQVLSGEKTSESVNQKWRANAPLLARGVQDGLIMYHAMPFNRYWVHRCRQVLTNMEISGSNWLDIDPNEKNELNTAKTNKLITAASKATLTPHHSLVKDYLLCNGKKVSVENFPNINLKNYNFFNIPKDKKGGYANQTGNKYNVRSQISGTTHYAVFNSLSSKKLPDLFNFENLSPRFIRGLNFSFSKDQVDVDDDNSYIISDEVNFDTKNNRVDTLWQSSSTYIMGYCDDSKFLDMKDLFGKKSKFFQKNISEVKLYPSSFDYLDKKWKHYHLLFSVDSGDRNGTNQIYIAKSKCRNQGVYGREDLESNILFKNVSSDGTLGNDWIDYCSYNESGKQNVSYFLNFQPIPTVGLFYDSKVDGEYNEYDFSNFYYYDAEGTLHKINTTKEETKNQQKIKMNEAEGIWPISVAGKASFSMQHTHFWQRKRDSQSWNGSDKYDDEYGELFKHDVSKYYFHGTPITTETDKQTYSPKSGYLWRTMTSLPLTNCEKLGCGDLTNYDPTVVKEEISQNDPDYYTYHNVTDQWRETKSFKKDNNYPGTKTKIKTTDNSPYPSHINLLPLIKL